jgi:hypothetical protein
MEAQPEWADEEAERERRLAMTVKAIQREAAAQP